MNQGFINLLGYVHRYYRLCFQRIIPKQSESSIITGPQRSFNRQRLDGITINRSTISQNAANSALYNYANKYSNVKSELAAAYFFALLREIEPNGTAEKEKLDKTLQSLFAIFFPGKQFVPPSISVNGEIQYFVSLSDGTKHDLDDLSSGEKGGVVWIFAANE